MRAAPLERLLATARSLPGDKDPVRLAIVAPPRSVTMAPARLADLDARAGAFLATLARRLEPALADALARAVRAWDQADSLVVLDAALAAEADSLRAELGAFLDVTEPVPRARALQALLMIEAAVGLVRLLETRLATFLRLRGAAELFPDGRPFLDVAGALAELARRWS